VLERYIEETGIRKKVKRNLECAMEEKEVRFANAAWGVKEEKHQQRKKE